MRTINQNKLKIILKNHKEWLYKGSGEYADLKYANLKYANLSSANLSGADLRRADLSGANLSEADLSRADLRFSSHEFVLPPEKGGFIGFKKCIDNRIVKLLILEDSKRTSATSRKCRASKVKVLEIYSENKKKTYETALSYYNNHFVYKINAIIEIADFDENRWNECSAGIHFYLTEAEAIRY